MRRPSISTAPELDSTMPRSVRAKVVLPLPDSPTSPSVSPGHSSAETPASALMSRPSCWKVFARSSIASSGFSSAIATVSSQFRAGR